MPKYAIDYEGLDSSLSKKAYRLSDVINRIEKVAFDLVRFRDGDEASNLWQIQSSDEGEFIVTLYEEVPEKIACPWEVLLSKTSGALNVYYKGEPLVSLAASSLGIPAEEVSQVPRYLPAKLSSNPRLVSSLLNQLPPSAKKTVYTRYPELLSSSS